VIEGNSAGGYRKEQRADIYGPTRRAQMDNALYHIRFREMHLTLYSNLQREFRSPLVVVDLVLRPSTLSFRTEGA
jgi:hypothetical protein